MSRKKSPVPGDSEANICVFCRRACGGCSWSEFDPMTGRPRFQPVPGWTAAAVRLFQNGSAAGETRYIDTWHITACPLFVPGRIGRPGKSGAEASARGGTPAGGGGEEGRSERRMAKKRKPRYCSRFYCESREGRFCCADCKLRRRCENSCLNDPARCGLEDKRR